jgi:RND family efflux transporter MFP subunit
MNLSERNGSQLMEPPTESPRFDVPVDDPHQPRPKLGLWALVIAVALIAGLIAGLLPRLRHAEAVKAETRELAIPTVITVSAVPSIAPTSLTLPAEVRAFEEAPIYARANGYLKTWLADIGARVEAGQLLAEIDTPELDQDLARARAELAQSQASLDLAKITAARWADLLKTSSVSDQEAAEKKADLALKLATVDAANANLHRLNELKSFARVTAPFAGTITARGTDIGQLIMAGSGRELFRLADTHKLRVFVRVPQGAAHSMVPGLKADLTTPEMANGSIIATVVRTSGAMAADSRTLLTELQVDNSNGEMLPGTYVQVRFREINEAVPLTLPANTLLFRAEGTQVGVVGADGVVVLHNIKMGRDFGAQLEILAGVTTADKVILNPPDSLVSGVKVKIAAADSQASGK